ncbi:T9SS type A sorting domain-containing protein [Flavobacteriaceae bacterium F08102]|nr:T9SS type A sorting domain-containing protein [Flavobacteriaceae bacterium F08102]
MSAQNIAELPLLQIDDLVYEGAFRLSAAEFGESNLNYAQGPIAYNKTNHSLYIVGHSHDQAIAEFSIPELVKSSDINALKMVAQPLQNFTPVLNKASGGNPQGLDRIGGLFATTYNGTPALVVNAYEYYDAPADNTQTTLTIQQANDLEAAQFSSFKTFTGGAGHTSGWISPVPTDLISVMGGTHITGQSSGIPIISRASVGPSAFAVDLADVFTENTVPTQKLLDFSLTHPLHADLSNTNGTNDIWTHLSRVVYGFIVPGTRTYITLGNSGGHSSGVCYKCTQNNGNLCGGYCAPDAEDYAQFYWLWDLNDLLDVKHGTKAAHEVRPYAFGAFETPFAENAWGLGGGSYDESSGILYVSLLNGDQHQGTYSRPPLILAYKVGSTLGDETAFEQELQIYPNPTNGIVQVKAPADDYHFEVFSLDGRLLQSDVKSGNAFTIDMTTWANGIYSVRVMGMTSKEMVVAKIIKY